MIHLYSLKLRICNPIRFPITYLISNSNSLIMENHLDFLVFIFGCSNKYHHPLWLLIIQTSYQEDSVSWYSMHRWSIPTQDHVSYNSCHAHSVSMTHSILPILPYTRNPSNPFLQEYVHTIDSLSRSATFRTGEFFNCFNCSNLAAHSSLPSNFSPCLCSDVIGYVMWEKLLMKLLY